MASLSKKFPQNCDGLFFVDSQCIDCDLCRQIAPDNFKRNFAGMNGHSYVARQPLTDREFSLCNDAMDSCPVNAIGTCRDVVEEEVPV